MNMMNVIGEEAPAKSVPAAAVIQTERVLLGITGRKGCVGGTISGMLNLQAQPEIAFHTVVLEFERGGKNFWSSGDMRRSQKEYQRRRQAPGS